MNALSDAEKTLAEARRDVHEYFVLLAAPNADRARAAVARLEAAVRHHDAETVRDLSRDGYSAQEAARKLDPEPTAHTGLGHPRSALPDWAIIQLSERGIDPGDVTHFIGNPAGDKLAAAVDGKPIHLTRD